MKTLSMQVGAEKAHGLRGALAPFNAELIEKAPEAFVVTVDVSSGQADIVSVLHAIQQYVTNRQAGRATIDLDGRTYLMDVR